ncbi:MAG TPA: S46 family peptidase, partial [Saprospiraceae bacterium]|nr:S46 family peptidase [Saprospiraceae bacterium]
MMNKLKVFLFVALFWSPVVIFAGEGMWLPIFLKALNESEMRDMGMKISADDIYNINKGSLKDAIVHFGGFCTSEIISDQGLLLTNHHCGYGQIQSHSSIDNNLLKNGFWASTLSDELPNPGLTATLIDWIDDVSNAALDGVTEDMSSTER